MSSLHPHTTPRNRLAVALAVAAGVGSGCGVIAATPARTPGATAPTQYTEAATHVLSVGRTSGSFVRRMRELEARGYVEVACRTDGALMFNPRTHRSEIVHA
jgi:hypothetical protein